MTTLSRVVGCIAETTRYPEKLLGAGADLENDLGIDSVKRLEIVVALENEFSLPLSKQQRDPTIRTIQDIADWVDGFHGDTSHPEHDGHGSPERTSRVVHEEMTRASSIPSREHFAEGPRIDGSHQDSGFKGHLWDETGSTAAGRQATPAISHRSGNLHHNPASHSNSFHSAPASPVGVPNSHMGQTHHADGVGNGQGNHGWHPTSAVNRLSNASIPNGAVPQMAPPSAAPPLRDGGSLRGKIALVTGSGRGVGRVIARVLASRGATVIINSFHSRELGEQTAAEINSGGGTAVHLWGSVANPAHVDEIFHQIAVQFGRLDILVCNASDGRIGNFMELSQEDWDRAFRTNVSGHHQCATRAASLMRDSGGGAIITMSAVGAKGYVDGLGSQGIVKAAVETMTRYLACELGRYGIRSNCVAGGPVYGELISKFPNAMETQHHWEAMTPDGQLCSPLDLANTIAFLVSDEARGINGSVWMVDHGFSAMAAGHPMRTSNDFAAQPIG